MRVILSLIISSILLTGCLNESDFGNVEKPVKQSTETVVQKPQIVEIDGETVEKEIGVKGSLEPFSNLAFKPVDRNLTVIDIRNILDTFAYGGFAKADQIERWTKMTPGEAIVEILNFNESNLKISPADSYDRVDKLKKKDILSLSEYWQNHKHTPIELKSRFSISDYNSIRYSWASMVNRRGLNPFREKIGFFETNNHIALNQDSKTSNIHLFSHYRDILQALSNGQSYDRVLSIGTLTAGVAFQYGHNSNSFQYGQFKGNEKFAQEYHQQLFKIYGDKNSTVHELVTVRNSAKALTDMSGDISNPYLGFKSDSHYIADLTLFDKDISGVNAKEKIFNLSKEAIDHNDSLDNLPIYILSTLADDNLTEGAKIRAFFSWKMMEKKSLLRFLQAYAVSTDFHSTSRYKYLNSIDRNFYILNKLTLNNRESYLNLYNPAIQSEIDGVSLFSPLHLESGHETGLESSNSLETFKNRYNNSSKNSSSFLQTSDINLGWKKDWREALPKEVERNGNYFVKDIAEWLWSYVVGDNLKHYGTLEKAHLTALLNGMDLGYFLNPADPERVWTTKELESIEIQEKIIDGGNAILNLNSSDDRSRESANRNINMAFTFIVATPFTFIDE